jgi:hypothetical protein
MKPKFRPNKRFKRDYDRLFCQNPEAANLFLLLCEMADERGQVVIDEAELAHLFNARFDDPQKHAFRGARP